jgi:LDH2 family malate/lactate/ureidoglycolate dehydrogenase
MLIKISELEEKMLQAMTRRGLSEQDARVVVEPFIEAELRGKRTHGINKFFVIDDGIAKRGKPEIVRDKFNYTLIDGHKELGFLCANMATEIAVRKAKEFGNALVGVTNAFYFSVLWPYARKIAEEGLIGIIMKSGAPAGVAAYGGADPVMGINPLAISIPTKADPIILDMAAAQKTWGEINLARVEKRALAEKTFIDKAGKFTTDPALVEAIVPFGGAKGYGLNLMIEIFTGAFLGAKMGLQVKEVYETGTFFLALSPEMFTEMDEFYEKVEVFKQELLSSRTLEGFSRVYLPGEQGNARLQEAWKRGEIDIKDAIWEALCAYAEGKNVKSALNIVL